MRMPRLIIYLLLFGIFIASCDKPTLEEKAKYLAEKEINPFLKESYYSINFRVDSAFTPTDDPVLYNKLTEFLLKTDSQLEKISEELGEIRSDIALHSGVYMTNYDREEVRQAKEKLAKKLQDSTQISNEMNESINSLTNMVNEKQKKFIGYRITDTYRIEYLNGRQEIESKVYLTNPECSKVIYTWDKESFDVFYNLINRLKYRNYNTQIDSL